MNFNLKNPSGITERAEKRSKMILYRAVPGAGSGVGGFLNRKYSIVPILNSAVRIPCQLPPIAAVARSPNRVNKSAGIIGKMAMMVAPM